MQIGYLILHGGEAFTPKSKDFDYIWLQLIRSQHRRPRVVVVPLATTANPGKVGEAATTYYKALGSFAEYTLITDQLSANTPQYYDILNKVEAICLADGNPTEIVEQLRGTHTETALHNALQRKAAVMGTGASAMAFGAAYWLGGDWEPGLAIAPHLAVIPHHEHVQMRLSPERLMAELPEGVTILGLDEATGVIIHPDGTYQVAGRGNVTVYRSVEHQDEYRGGETFTLTSTD